MISGGAGGRVRVSGLFLLAPLGSRLGGALAERAVDAAFL